MEIFGVKLEETTELIRAMVAIEQQKLEQQRFQV